MTDPKTDHAEKAREFLDNAYQTMNKTLAHEFNAAAQVHATLTLEAQTARLADAQEVANLVLVAAHLDSVGEPSDDFWADATTLTRLDLTQDVTP